LHDVIAGVDVGIFTSIEGPHPGVTPIGRAIAALGYLEEEYVVAGTADLFTFDDDWRPVVERPAVPFTTRILVRRPSDPVEATGSVVLEPLHPAGDMAAAWPRTGRMLTRERWSWVGVTQDVAGLAAITAADPDRYGDLDIPEPGLGFDIVAAAATWLRAGGADALVLDHLFMTGASYTGTFQRVFLGEGFHDRARRPDGGPAVEGYLIQISSGGFVLGGYHPLSPSSGRPPADHPRRVVQPHDVPVIELLSEGEAQTNLRSRRPDSDEPGDRYRLYEVPGACHMSRAESRSWQLPPTAEEPSTFPMYALAGGALENLRRWAVEGVPPPRAARIELVDDPGAPPDGDGDEALPCARDGHGNALGGVRMPEVDVPVASYLPRSTLLTAASVGPPGRRALPLGSLMGSMTPFPPEKLRDLYGTPAGYLGAYRLRLDELVAERWIVPADAERMLGQAAAVEF
jgi:Alpha/beta hydrolase domain